MKCLYKSSYQWIKAELSYNVKKEMAIHSSILAWRIPGTEEPGGLPSMGSHRVGHDWSDLAAAAAASYNKTWESQWLKTARFNSFSCHMSFSDGRWLCSTCQPLWQLGKGQPPVVSLLVSRQSKKRGGNAVDHTQAPKASAYRWQVLHFPTFHCPKQIVCPWLTSVRALCNLPQRRGSEKRALNICKQESDT